ncbi:hypothetical protein J4Q44_G00325970, partial [Coregonus suidteri]
MQQQPEWEKSCSQGMSRICWCLIRYAGEDSCAWIHVGSNIPSELMLIVCCCLLDLQQGLDTFNRESVKSAWYGNCLARNCRALQRVVRSVQSITGSTLPALEDTYSTRCHRKAKKIIKDINHPSHGL